jgi:EAL domain-containing protein (putative c-di-GMP-specific phosphodiesterase class I)
MWQQIAGGDPPLTVNINLCVKQFSQADLIERIDEILRETNFNPRNLKLEITESTIMGNAAAAVRVLLALRDMGIDMHIDDFGTGYSSLSYLQRLPVNMLKIDRSFISRMCDNDENVEIVRTIIQLGHNLKMEVMAEGIETEEQLIQLMRLNCEYGQGYYFSEPVGAEAAQELVKERFVFHDTGRREQEGLERVGAGVCQENETA